MKSNHWAQQFLDVAIAAGAPAVPTNYANGWLESALIKGKTCFLKSMTFNPAKGLYFVGVDPSKLTQTGHAVVLCGGGRRELRDIFVIPWSTFFSLLGKGAPINTYAHRTYLQYKAHMVDHRNAWELRVQGGTRPVAPATAWRFDPRSAVAAI